MWEPSRRGWLKGVAGGALALLGRRPASAARRPRTLDDILDGMEQVLAPEALAVIYATPEPQLLDFSYDVLRLLELRFGEDLLYSRPETFRLLGVSDVNEGKIFLVTALARRHHGQPLNVDEQLAPARAIGARRRVESEAERAANPGVRVRSCGWQFPLLEELYFQQGAVRLLPGQEKRVADVVELLKGYTRFQLIQVQGHAHRRERDGQALSVARARWITDELVRGGVEPARLIAHGFGAAYPSRVEASEHLRRLDHRVNFIPLKRPYD